MGCLTPMSSDTVIVSVASIVLSSIFLKSILVALLFTGPTGFMIGFPGTILSFVVMKLLSKALKEEKYMPFVSAVGGLSHSFGQIISAFIIYGITKIEAFIVYAPLIFVISIFSGILVGNNFVNIFANKGRLKHLCV